MSCRGSTSESASSISLSDERLPLFERIKFLAIFSEGLDEFFQVRVAGLEDQVAAGLRLRSPDGMGPAEQLSAIADRTTELVARESAIFAGQVRPALAAHGLAIVDFETLGERDRAYLTEVFHQQIFPILTPLAVDQAHPFPYISNLALNLVVRVEDPRRGEQRIARVKVPPLLPRFVILPDERRLVPLEQVMAAHLEALFPSMAIIEHHAFRVTRNADLSVEEDEAQDLPAAIELELHRRRFGQAVRLEVADSVPADLLTMLIDEVDVPENNVFLLDVPLDLGGLRCLTELPRLDLAPEPWAPLTPPQLATDRDIFTVLGEGDVLVHHPYESFAASVEAFIARAAEDPDVLAIKQTLYRTGEDSATVDSLVRASESGKQVTAVVELQARFDEQTNLERARALEEAGVQVIYGFVRFKTHSKISLVVRREGDRIRRYCHIGSGNYNATTARIYEDVGLLTADPDVGRRRGGAVQPSHRLRGATTVPPVDGVAAFDPLRAHHFDPRRDRSRACRADRPQDQRAHRPGDHRRPLRGLACGCRDRPRGARALLPAAGGRGTFGEHPGPFDRREVPRALADLPLRRRART